MTIDTTLDRDLYRRNGFRVTGLPVTATTRMIKRRRREYDLGVQRESAAPQAASETELGQAFARIDDPRSRIVDELTWVWRDDAGLDAEVADAHDRTVLAHCRALELEAVHEGTGPAGAKERHEAWRTAMRGWASLSRDERMWAHLSRRVTDLADPRLTTGDVDTLRSRLVAELLATSARLAVVRARAAGDDGGHRAFMAELADGARVDRALGDAAAPTVREIDEICSAARDAPRTDLSAAERLLRDTRPALQTLRALFAETDPSRRRALNAVAVEVRQIVVGHLNDVVPGIEPTSITALASIRQLAQEALALLARVRDMVSDPEERKNLDADTTLLKRLVENTSAVAAPPSVPSTPYRQPAGRQQPGSGYTPPASRPSSPSPAGPVTVAVLAVIVAIVGGVAGSTPVLVIALFVAFFSCLVALSRWDPRR